MIRGVLALTLAVGLILSVTAIGGECAAGGPCCCETKFGLCCDDCGPDGLPIGCPCG